MGEGGEELRRAVLAVAIRAGRVCLAAYRAGGGPTMQKPDGSPVTGADLEADRLIREALEGRFPWPVLSEESAIPPWGARRSWSRFWLVDPMDGTKEFVRRTGDFTVNIALVEGGRPILGVIVAPALGRAWSAVAGGGVFRRVGPREERLRARLPKGPRLALVSRFHKDPALDVYLAERGVEATVAVGSAVKFGRMAEGFGDLYPRFGPTMEWDVAAGDCIASEAGCTLVRLSDGAPLQYGKEDLHNPGFVVTSRRLGATPTAG